ncbi:ATP-binding protein [Poseidonibacter sp.]|uniref:PAS domain-containing sensor histidine kinase n=1 Tax=Poseidonibacter sp. TaxID=2321188 RepID=UPI003C77E987
MNVNKFDLICDTIDNGVVLIDSDLKVYFWNSWLESRTKITSSDIMGKNLDSFFPELNEKKLKRKINTSLKLNSPTFYNTKIDKFLINIELGKVTDKVFENMQQAVTITPYNKDENLAILYIYDNTMLRETNHKLEYANEELELLLNATMESIILFHDDKFINCNELALELFNYKSIKNLIGKDIYYFINKTYNLKSISNHKKPVEILITPHNANSFPALIKIKDTTINDKNFKILTVIDISELKAKDKLISEQSKMAAMGEMIGNIAHQWRQPLSTISTAASGIKFQKELNILTDNMFSEAIDGIVRNAKHLSQTIEDFKEFIKGDKKKVLFNVKTNINKNLSILEGMIKNESIKVVVNIPEYIEIMSYPNELTQAFLNIINNAKDALVQNKHKDDLRLIIIDVKSENKSITIKVTDNAGGIQKKIIHNIFEPYFTTKHKNQGTGLGLYMTHQLVNKNMHGKISAKNTNFTYDNTNYYGASFKITLPI